MSLVTRVWCATQRQHENYLGGVCVAIEMLEMVAFVLTGEILRLVCPPQGMQ